MYVGVPAPPAVVAVRVITPPTHIGLVADEVSVVTDGCVVIVYMVVLANGTEPQLAPGYTTLTLYAPVIAPPDVVTEGSVLDEVVVVAIPGPLHVNVGMPPPPVPTVAVSVTTPPEQNELVEEELSAVIAGCAFNVYTVAAANDVVLHPAPL